MHHLKTNMPRPREPLPVLPRKTDTNDKATASDSSDGGNSGKEWEVESIVSHHVDSKGNWIFKTKWVGWPEESNTNEPLQHFVGSYQVISEYLRKHGFQVQLDKKSSLLSISKLEHPKEPTAKSGDKVDPKAVSNTDKNSIILPVVRPVPLKRYSKDKVMLPTFSATIGKSGAGDKRKSQSLTKTSLTKASLTREGQSTTDTLRSMRKETRQPSTSTSDSSTPSPVAVKKSRLQIFRTNQTANPSKNATSTTQKRKRQKFSFVTAEINSETDEEFDEYTVEDPAVLHRPGGYAQGKVAEKILGVADLNERPIRYIVKWADSNTVEPVPSDLVLQEDANLLLTFFESRLVDKAAISVKRFKR